MLRDIFIDDFVSEAGEQYDLADDLTSP